MSKKEYPTRSKSIIILRLVFKKVKGKLIDKQKEDKEEVEERLRSSKSSIHIGVTFQNRLISDDNV